MIKVFVLALCFVLPAVVLWPQNGASEISWNEFYKLQWDDFQGKPNTDSRGDAGTAVVIRAKPYLQKKRVKYDVVAIFDRNRSWVRDKSSSLLAHEQLHFDIAELYARKIRKRISGLTDQGVKDVAVYDRAIRGLLVESNEVDMQYDIETLHGALQKKQAAWSMKVNEELARLDKYKKPKRIIGGS